MRRAFVVAALVLMAAAGAYGQSYGQTAVSVTPNTGGGLGPQIFTAVYTDTLGASDLKAVFLDFANAGGAPNSCLVSYVRLANQLFLFNDNNSALLGPITPGSPSTIANSQCTLTGAGGAVTSQGPNLIVPYSISFSDTFNPGAPITVPPLPGGVVNKPYPGAQFLVQNIFGQVQTNGNVQSAWVPLGAWTPQGPQSYTWTLASGLLPQGVSLNPQTGLLGGTPTQAGTFSFTVRVTSSGGLTSLTPPLSLVIVPQLVAPPQVLPTGMVNSAYPATNLIANGGSPPYGWTLTSGSLPPGLMLSGAGVISGTPAVAGVFAFTATVTDNGAGTLQQTATQGYTIAVSPPALTITTGSLPSGTVGSPYTAPLSATGGQPPYNWAASGLPMGLGISGNQITGTPQAPFNGNVIITVTDSLLGAPPNTAQKTLALVINPVPLSISGTCPAASIPFGVPFSTAFTASGGNGRYTWSLTANPSFLGLIPNGASATVAGTPNASGPFSFTLTLTDSAGTPAASRTCGPITVGTPLSISGTCPAASVPLGIPISAPFTASGGNGNYTWSLTANPSFLSLMSSGASATVTGTPNASGPFSFAVILSDSAGTPTVSRTCGPANVLKPLSLNGACASARVGSQYSIALIASGGNGIYSLSFTGPSWLTLSPATGVAGSGGFLNVGLTGFPPSAGPYPVSVTLNDTGGSSPATFLCTVNINAATLSVVQTALATGTVNVGYPANSLSATGGTPPYTWSLTAGSLPPGLSLSSSGVIAGNPTASGAFSFIAQVTDSGMPQQTASGSFSINISTGVTISPGVLPPGDVGVPYTPVQLSISGASGTAGPTWSVSGGTLPPGLTLSQSGVLQGTPTQAGVYTFSIGVAGPAGSGSMGYAVRINPAPAFSPISIPDTPANTPLQVTLVLNGGTPPYTWSIAGALPPGVTFDGNGNLSGAPTTAGTYTFSVQVTDAAGATASTRVTINVIAALAIATQSLPPGVVGIAYKPVSLQGAGGRPPYTWSSSGNLPPGLTLDSTGALSGTPSQAGQFSFTALVTDASGAKASGTVSITITTGPTIFTTQVSNGVLNQLYPAFAFAAAGGTQPYTWSVSGTLPPGLSLGPDGTLTGTPTQLGSFAITVQVKDATGAIANAQFTIQIVPAPLTITTNSLPAATGESAYQIALAASGGTPPYIWSVSGTLPSGLTLSSGGVLSGTPTLAGSYNLTVQVSDSGSPSTNATKTFSLTVNLPASPPLLIQGLPGTLNAAQQNTFTVSLGSNYPAVLNGTLLLQFASTATNPAPDPMVLFLSGGTTLQFTVPANQTTAVFTAPRVGVQTGTVAGMITVSIVSLTTPDGTSVLPNPAPAVTINVPAGPPVISSPPTVTKTTGGLTVTIQGYSPLRTVTNATFHFAPSDGSTLQTSDFTVDVTSAFNQYYQGTSSMTFGSMFVYAQPFTFQGTLNSGSITVTLSNSAGSSPPMTVQF